MSISNQLTIDKSRLLPYTLAIVATCAFVYQSNKQPTVLVKDQVKVITKTVDKVVYKDRVRVIKEVITKPDGTKIDRVVTDDTKSGSHTKQSENNTTQTTVRISRLPSYSLSVSCNIRDCYNYASYQIMGGFRLGQLPLNLEVGGGINGILIGIRYDF